LSKKAVELTETKDFPQALRIFNKVLELDSKYAAAYNNRGIIYSKQKEFQKAIDDYNKTIELDLKLH